MSATQAEEREDGQLWCMECEEAFSDEETYAEHRRNAHQEYDEPMDAETQFGDGEGA